MRIDPVAARDPAPVVDIYAARDVPVQSCQVFRDAAEARSCLHGDVALIRDETTGLVSNRLFEPATQVFDGNYEETQIYAPRFREFVARTVGRLAARDLAGKRVVEVGCGKGDFLIALCRATGAEGFGIDPSFRADRHETTGSARFLAEPLGPEHADLKPDLVICRHTLEHIGDPAEFLRQLADLAGRSGVPILIDVPDARRIVAEGAFWDIYYEHAHYFTETSLKAVLAHAGLAGHICGRSFAGHFLEIEAHVGAIVTRAAPIAEWRGFTARAQARMSTWRRWLEARCDLRVVLWGAGSKAVAFLSAAGSEHITAAIDVNPHKAGSFLAGSALPVFGPESVAELAPDAVIVMNPVYRDEIAGMLADRGLSPEIAAPGLPCAR